MRTTLFLLCLAVPVEAQTPDSLAVAAFAAWSDSTMLPPFVAERTREMEDYWHVSYTKDGARDYAVVFRAPSGRWSVYYRYHGNPEPTAIKDTPEERAAIRAVLGTALHNLQFQYSPGGAIVTYERFGYVYEADVWKVDGQWHIHEVRVIGPPA